MKNKSKLMKNIKKALGLAILSICRMIASSQSVFAATGFSAWSGNSANTMATNLKTQLLTYASYGGIILLAVGIIALVVSFSEERPEGKVGAIRVIIAGVGLKSISTISSTIGTSTTSAAKLFVTLAQWMGTIGIVFAIILIIMAMRNEDVEGRNRSLALMVASAGLLGVGSFIA